jgi:hypothetical protein
MALSIIIDENLQKTKFIKGADYPLSNIVSTTRQIRISEVLQKTKSIDQTNYPISDIFPITRQVEINEVLPFRIRFTTIGLAGPNANVPGIGLQIIGINNYIL